MNQGFKIPVEEVICEFEAHLEANDRTILSSKFGDGKSYFLEQVKADDKLSKNYEFLTIYPVNYQVSSNDDIFQLLKRDLLFQMFRHSMIDNELEISEKEMFSWYIHLNGKDILADLIPSILELGIIPEQWTKILKAIKDFKPLKTIREKFNKFKEEHKSDFEKLDSFLDDLKPEDKFEFDPITAIIRKSLQKFRKGGKKVVLIIEDMDRLDPAHLFRIMNMLSAHIDYSYKFAVKPDATLTGNKFDLDKIIIVIDYLNLQNIFKHFYGAETDFIGYISKFLSSTPFYYSLEEQKSEYIISKLEELTSVPKNILSELLSKDILQSSTMRDLIQSFDINNQLINIPTVKVGGEKVKLDTSIQRLMAVLRRLKKTDVEIVAKILEIEEIDSNYFLSRTCQYLSFKDEFNTVNCIIINDRRYGKVQMNTYIQQNGCANWGEPRYLNDVRISLTDFTPNIKKMLSFVVK